MHPGNAKMQIKAFNNDKSEPYDYLLLGYHPVSDKYKKVLTNIKFQKYYNSRVKTDIKYK